MKNQERELVEAYLSQGKNLDEIEFNIVRRHGHLLLALPQQRLLAKKVLQLYQPQKWKGRLLVLGLRFAIFTNLYRLGPKLKFPIGDQGLATLLKDRIHGEGFGFLLGSADSQQRSMTAITESSGRVVVVKAAMGDAASSVEHEYQNLCAFASRVKNALKPIDKGEFPGGFYYVTEYIQGVTPRGEKQHAVTQRILEDWIAEAPKKCLGEIESWCEMLSAHGMNKTAKDIFLSLQGTEVLAPVGHGDYVPWNLKFDGEGAYHILDWESAKEVYVPGWDMWHYWVQKWTLIDECSPKEVFLRAMDWLKGEVYQNYMAKAGGAECGKEILGSYLYYSGLVQGYERGDLISEWEKEFL